MSPNSSSRDVRLTAIRGILESKMISSQADLSTELTACGIAVTQATLSRDLTDLGATRVPSTSGRRYVIPSVTRDLNPEVVDTMVDVTDAAATVVIRTSGDDGGQFADFLNQDPALAALVIGAVGSSDTVMVAMRHPYRATDLMHALNRRRVSGKDRSHR